MERVETTAASDSDDDNVDAPDSDIEVNGAEEENDDDDKLFEEEEEDEEDSTVKSKKKGKKATLKSDISQHKEELELLKEQDPEFYEYLKKEESGLLDFDVSDEDLEDASEGEDEGMLEDEEQQEASQFSDNEADQEDEPMPSATNASEGEVVTKQMIEEWAVAIETRKSVKTLKHLLSAFKCAARMNDEDDENTTYTYKVTSGAGM